MFRAHRGKSTSHLYRAHKTKHGRKIEEHGKHALKSRKPKRTSPAKIKAAKVKPYKSLLPHVPAGYKQSRKPKPYRPVKPPIV